MKTIIPFLFILILAFTAFGQKKPDPKTVPPLVAAAEYSSVYDIRNFEKFFITSLSPRGKKSIEAIGKVLSRERSITSAGLKEAQFFLCYREINKMSQLRVFYILDKKNIIVWAEDRKALGRETELTEAFLEVLQRNKKLDEADKPVADAE